MSTQERPTFGSRYWLAAFLVLGLGSFVLGRSLLEPAGAAEAQPLEQIQEQPFVLDLSGSGFELKPGLSVPYDGTERQAQVVTQPVYFGSLARERLEVLIKSGRAAALERRMTKAWQAKLRARIADLEQALWEVTQDADDEYRTAMASAIKSKTNVWHFPAKTKSSEQAARHADLMRRVQRLSRQRKAQLVTTGRGDSVRYVLLRREVFPVYFDYADQFIELLQERRRRAAIEVGTMFDKHGMDLFAPAKAAK